MAEWGWENYMLPIDENIHTIFLDHLYVGIICENVLTYFNCRGWFLEVHWLV